MLITTQHGFDELIARLRDRPVFCLDTEFISERTYRPELCLVQIGVDDDVYAVDPLEVSSLDGFLRLIVDPALEKVVHAGRQDMMIFYDLGGDVPRNVFDTQVAAALVGHGDSIGHSKLVEALVGKRLRRAESYTDWSRRPLSDSQIAYALDDVRYLLAMRERLVRDLEAHGRERWLAEELAIYDEVSLYRRDPREMWRRVKGAGRLDGVELSVLRELAAWREEEAIRRNRPRGRILGDEQLVALSRRRPTNRPGLEEMRGLHARVVERSGKAVLAAIAGGAGAPRSSWPELPDVTPKDARLTLLVDLMETLLKARAAEQRISPGYLATRGQLYDVARSGDGGDVDLPVLSGWRRELIGRELLALLEGRLAVTATGSPPTVVVEER